MIDLARVLALLLGIARSARHRFAWGALLGALAAYPMALLTASAFAARPAHAPPLLGFAFVLFGPSALQGALARTAWPLAGLFEAWPLAIPLASGALAAGGAAIASRRASARRPESEEARALDGIATPFVLAAVLDGIVAVCGVMVRLLNR